MFKYTTSTLERIERLLQECGYIVRYERGNFQPGYCILHNQKVLVVNKFFETEGRINALLEIISQLPIDPSVLSEEQQIFFGQLTTVKKSS